MFTSSKGHDLLPVTAFLFPSLVQCCLVKVHIFFLEAGPKKFYGTYPVVPPVLERDNIVECCNYLLLLLVLLL